ncbi:MAG: ATP-dependent Clp protease ATP-binding subunit [Clostridia bacterium]|nr:ATP-dependent Clp protease ATP-binding subunit [Clostridia bacterium]
MANKFTQKAQNTLMTALEVARELGHTYVGSEHILYGLATDTDSISGKLLSSHSASPEKIRKAISELAGTGSKSHVTPYDMTPRAKRIIEDAALYSENDSKAFIGTEHLLSALLSQKESIAVKVLSMLGVKTYEIERELSGIGSIVSDKKESKSVSKPNSEDKVKIKGAPTLSLYGKELTEFAKRGAIDPVIGREEETDRVIQILSRRTKNNPCLIGEPGVGKTAVVEGLAQRIIDGSVPSLLTDRRIVTLDISSMIAGSKYRGEFEERMKNVMEDIRKNPDIILFIDEIHMIIGAGAAEGAVDAANILKPALARGELQMIGATTISEYRQRIEKDAALERRFQSVSVDEPDTQKTVMILKGIKEKYEEHHRLSITDEAIEAAVSLSKRYIPDRFLPDKAIDLLDEAASKVRIRHTVAQKDPPIKSVSVLEKELDKATKRKENAIINSDLTLAKEAHEEEERIKAELESAKIRIEKSIEEKVNAYDVATIVTEWTGIPVSIGAEEENEKLLHLETTLSKRIIGQHDAIKTVAEAIRRGRLGFKDPNRPTGTFIFYGPTGVGKTELAKALAAELFGSEESLIRFDMSEYMERHSISKLIGSPPGYVGYEEGGRLTEKVRRRPYSVVLFDEIEKAHGDVFNLLLQILDDGCLTDSAGRRVDFKNTVIIMTSNCGSGISRTSLGFSDAESTAVTVAPTPLKKIFSDEFLARVDEILTFSSLHIPELTLIAESLLSNFAKRAASLGLQLSFDSSVSAFLAEEAYREKNGARPLRKAMTRYVENTVSSRWLSGEIKQNDRVRIFAQNRMIKVESLESVRV